MLYFDMKELDLRRLKNQFRLFRIVVL